jgi:cell division protein ZapA (FtsZ GTPase activity inhibitor)
MERPIRVTIAGREYVLRGEDEEQVLRSAQEVEQQWKLLQGQVPEQSTATMAILVALNLAEQYHRLRRQAEVDLHYVRESLDRMVAYVEEQLSALGVGVERPGESLTTDDAHSSAVSRLVVGGQRRANCKHTSQKGDRLCLWIAGLPA